MTHIELEEAEKMIDSALKRAVHQMSPDTRRTFDLLSQELKNLSKKLDDHIEQHEKDSKELKDILTAYAGGKLLGNALKWGAGVAGALMIIRALINGKL